MTKVVKCKNLPEQKTENVRVRVIRAPIVDTKELRHVVYQRARALVL